MTKAIDDVIAERQRQVKQEGWTTEHDDLHDDESLACAAACYALPHQDRELSLRIESKEDDRVPGEYDEITRMVQRNWPQSWGCWFWKPKPQDRRRELIKAAALLIAEIERLDRKATP